VIRITQRHLIHSDPEGQEGEGEQNSI